MLLLQLVAVTIKIVQQQKQHGSAITNSYPPPLTAVPSEPPQNVRAISVTSDEAVITWSEPPRLTLHGVLKGYRVVFWSLFSNGGGWVRIYRPSGLQQFNYHNYTYSI